MALGYLFILFIFITAVSIVGILLLYLLKNQRAKNIVFYFLAVWSMCIAFLDVTSLPSNYLMERLIALSFGVLSIIAIIFKIKKPEKPMVAYILVTASVLLTLMSIIF